MNRSLLLLALACGLASATQFDDCGSTASGVTFSVAGCETPPCTVHVGAKIPINITFVPDHDISDVTAKVDAIIAGIPIPWPGFDTDGCKYLVGEQCPVKAGSTVTWGYPVYVDPSYPQIKVDAEFMVLDGDKKQACCRIPVIVAA